MYKSEYDFAKNFDTDGNLLLDPAENQQPRSETEVFIEEMQDDNILYKTMGAEYNPGSIQSASERAESQQFGDTFEANDLQKMLQSADIKETEGGGSSGDGKSSQGTAHVKTRRIQNNLGTLKSNNERFLFLFREAIKRFRIPQYGFQEMGGAAGSQNLIASQWKLTQPQLVNNSYIAYDIEGKDHLGPFNAQRRYNNFFELRNSLCQNWPGVYIPNVPPKKAMGNKDIEFVVERRYYLERFFMQVADIEHLRTSEEMKVFIRPELTVTSSQAATIDIDKALLKLSRPSPGKLLAIYKKAFKLTDKIIEEQKLAQNENCEKLEQTLQLMKILNNNYCLLKKQAFGMIQIKNNQIDYQKQIIKTLSRYELQSQKFIRDFNQI